MAVVISDERARASRALLSLLKSIRTDPKRNALAMSMLKTAGAERPIVLALEADLLGDVVRRMHTYAPPVLIAVYYPESASIKLAEIGLAERDSDSAVFGATTTVGMFLDASAAMSIPDSWETIEVTKVVLPA